ncbi:4Fe-4S dicluster domain-containing protein [Desulfosarcina ovata]|uniref:4Fe-4S ferredoxin n=1 Tax=Desulfosarcina ovata subsp. ovata TaxID=2752305 RepID=A0A5K8AKT0_9BACT|nr:4Fe-4S dicluster domain-containing protein [Desulfosarcina ovata]BBO93106.1 4Fe-4S ferredoxin [Desulfosarcina ovata subsp. ovata]
MSRYAMMIDLDRCVRCRTCYVVCKIMHDIPNQFECGRSYTRIRLMEPEIGEYPDVRRYFVPYHCMQCENPACVAACEVEASFIREDGIVAFDPEKCIGCEACVDACPYHARYINEETGKVDGCDMCAERIDAGQGPWCVERCIGSAMIFGDLDDPASDIVKAIRESGAKPLSGHFGTQPKVFYANLKIADKTRIKPAA